MLIIVYSEDKLSLSMFCSFFKKIYCNNIIIKDLNSLFDFNYQEFFLNWAVQESNKGANILIKYKIKNNIIPEIPIVDKANLIVKFEGIYSTMPIIIKTNIPSITIEQFIKNWNTFIK